MSQLRYGAEVAVPGGVDILIAGTSCKDASSLNNHKQGLDSALANPHAPIAVCLLGHETPSPVLENVCGAPWKLMYSDFDEIGYQATYRQD